MKNLLCLVLALLLTLPPLPAQAWSEGGHHLIAVMAFRKLPKDKQAELSRILKAHPRFAEDFKLPKKVRNEEEWLIGRASYWPDVARSQPEYDRPNWHYELGVTINLGVANPPAFPGPLPADATPATKDLHIAQALELNSRILHDRSKPDSERAIALCWVAHLVAEAHQPCNAGSLYVEGVFPEGDRGGNEIKTKQSKNLHALWDGLLGPKWDEADLNRRAKAVEDDDFVTRTARAASQMQDAATPSAWLKECRGYASSTVYAPPVLQPIIDAHAHKTELPELDLPESYLKAAGQFATQHAATASFRLAKVLSFE